MAIGNDPHLVNEIILSRQMTTPDGTSVINVEGSIPVFAGFSVIAAGKATWSGSGATKAATVTGVATGDIVIATIQTKPTQAAYLVGAVPTANTITFELSAANTSNDAVIAYQVIRAA